MLTNLPSSTVKLMSWMTVNLSSDAGAGNRFVRFSMVMAEVPAVPCHIEFPEPRCAVVARSML